MIIESEIRVGDKVKVIRDNSAFAGYKGIVVGFKENTEKVPYTVLVEFDGADENNDYLEGVIAFIPDYLKVVAF